METPSKWEEMSPKEQWEWIKKNGDTTWPLNKSTKSKGKEHIEKILMFCGMEYKKEHMFSERKFRFDFYIPALNLAAEYEGIFSSDKSRHTNVIGYTNDATKYNMATVLGIKVLRYTAKNYKEFGPDLKKIQDGQGKS